MEKGSDKKKSSAAELIKDFQSKWASRALEDSKYKPKKSFNPRDIGFKKLIFTHPMGIGANRGEIAAMAQLGGYIEFSYLHVLLQRVQISDIIDTVKKIGPKKNLLTTDAFFSWTPPEPEMFRLFVGILHYHGLKPHHIRQMVYDNPRKLLDLSKDDNVPS